MLVSTHAPGVLCKFRRAISGLRAGQSRVLLGAMDARENRFVALALMVPLLALFVVMVHTVVIPVALGGIVCGDLVSAVAAVAAPLGAPSNVPACLCFSPARSSLC